LTAAAAGEAAWFGGAKRAAEPGCERSERQRSGGEPRPRAAATQERRLLGVGSIALLGAGDT